MTNRTKSYFNSVASNYSNSSKTGLWNLVRNNEKKILLSFLTNKEYKNILELGSGSGFYTNYLSNYTKNKITCVDFSKVMLDQIQLHKVIKINEDIETFSNGLTYDLIFCAGAIEFTENPIDIFINAKAMLKPNGTFIILVPRKNLWGVFYKVFHFFNGVKINLFSSKGILNYSNSCGLELKQKIRIFPFSLGFYFKK